MKKKLSPFEIIPKYQLKFIIHYFITVHSVHLSCINPYKWEIQDFTLSLVLNYYTGMPLTVDLGVQKRASSIKGRGKDIENVPFSTFSGASAN